MLGPEAEAATVAGAVRTDLILSAEIMVISLKEVIDEPFIRRALVLVVVAVVITAAIYGVVALIVKMDDVGLRMAARPSAGSQRVGRAMVAGMPKLLAVLSVVGTAAMLWVGGHILIAGAHELGWHWPYDVVHDLSHGRARRGRRGRCTGLVRQHPDLRHPRHHRGWAGDGGALPPALRSRSRPCARHGDRGALGAIQTATAADLDWP